MNDVISAGSERRRLSIDAVLTAVGYAAAPASAAISAPLLARGLGVAARGDVASATSPLLFAATVAAFGTPDAIVFFGARGREWLKSLWHLSLVTVLIGAAISGVVFCLVAVPIAGGDRDLAGLTLACLTVLPVLLVLGIARASSASQKRWVLVNVERSLTAVLRVIAIALLVATNALDVATAAWAIVLSQVAGLLAYVPLCFGRKVGKQLTVSASSFVRYSATVWVGSLSGVILLRLDQVLFASLGGDYQLGLYAVAVSIGEIGLVVSNAIRDVLFSAESSAPDRRRLEAAARVSLGSSSLTAVVIAVASYFLLPTLFGLEFSASWLPLAIVLVGLALGSPGSVVGSGLSARGRPGLRSVSLGMAAAVNVLLLLLLIPAGGAVGAAVATALSASLAGFLNCIFARRVFGLSVLHAYMPGWLGPRRSRPSDE